MATAKISVQKFNAQFNDLAADLGCRARLAGGPKRPQFQIWNGDVSTDGYEMVLPITATRFDSMIQKHPALVDFLGA